MPNLDTIQVRSLRDLGVRPITITIKVAMTLRLRLKIASMVARLACKIAGTEGIVHIEMREDPDEK